MRVIVAGKFFVTELQMECAKLGDDYIHTHDDGEGRDNVSFVLEGLESGDERDHVVSKCIIS